MPYEDTPTGLHRSVHPSHFPDLIVSHEAFSPKGEDGYRLSVDCEKVFTARQSYEYRTITLARQSAGIWTISREEYTKLGLAVSADQIPGNLAHSLVLFPANDKSKRRDLARRLAFLANERAYSSL